MRIVVPIKQVPETGAVKMDEQTGTMIREGVEAIVNPLDLYAIELAIRLREEHAPRCPQDDGACVTAISMGPPKSVTALREAVAMGVDDAVLLSEKAFAGSDTWATSYVLAAAIRRMGSRKMGTCSHFPKQSEGKRCPSPFSFSLIICGERATDGDTGQVGPGIASFLDLPVLTYVSKVEEVRDDSIRVQRLVEGGYEVLQADLPCVLTVVKEVANPRLPTLRGKQKARRAEIPVWGLADLGLEADKVGLSGSPTRVVRIFRPKVARQCRKVTADEASISAAANQLVKFLRAKGLA